MKKNSKIHTFRQCLNHRSVPVRIPLGYFSPNKSSNQITHAAGFTRQHTNFLTNNFTISAQMVADLYRQRWQVELFFKWIKSFYGTSENAVKSQIWIAVSVYVRDHKKRLGIKENLYTILQVLSVVTIFEKTPLVQSVTGEKYNSKNLNILSI